MSSCVAAGRYDLLYELVGELQLEIDSLKHNTNADRKKLQSIRQQVYPAPWLALKEARAISDQEFAAVSSMFCPRIESEGSTTFFASISRN